MGWMLLKQIYSLSVKVWPVVELLKKKNTKLGKSSEKFYVLKISVYWMLFNMPDHSGHI